MANSQTSRNIREAKKRQTELAKALFQAMIILRVTTADTISKQIKLSKHIGYKLLDYEMKDRSPNISMGTARKVINGFMQWSELEDPKILWRLYEKCRSPNEDGELEFSLDLFIREVTQVI